MKKIKLKKILGFFKKKKKKKRNYTYNYILFKDVKRKNIWKKRKKIQLSFQKSKINFFKNNRLYLYIWWFVLFMCFSFYLLFWPAFKLRVIEIIKKDDITSMNIAYKAVEDFRWESLLYLETKRVSERIKSYQENIKYVQINKRLPNKLYIELESYKSLFNVFIGWENYLLLENGSLLKAKKDKNIKNLYIVNNFGKNMFLWYKKVFQQDAIQKIQQITKKIWENINGVISELRYFNFEKEVHIQLNGFTLLMFSLDDDISVEEQIRNLSIFDKEHISLSQKTLIYLDLRVKWKIFSCDVENKNTCYNNLKYLYKPTERAEEKKKD